MFSKKVLAFVSFMTNIPDNVENCLLQEIENEHFMNEPDRRDLPSDKIWGCKFSNRKVL